MRRFLLSLSPYIQIFIILFGTVFVAFVSSVIMHLILPSEEVMGRSELIISIYTVLGTIYAVLIAFAVSGVWKNYCDAEMTIATEVAALNDLIHLVKASSAEKTKSILKTAMAYTQSVLHYEWPLLAKGQNALVMLPDSTSLTLALKLVEEVQSIKPMDARDNVIFSHILTLLTKWLDARRMRIILSKGNIAKSLWPFLIAGALVLFAFHGMFIVHDHRLWACLLLLFSGVIGLSFYLIFTLDSPFSGVPAVDTEPFEWMFNWFKHQDEK